jgi:hypothetical protein
MMGRSCSLHTRRLRRKHTQPQLVQSRTSQEFLSFPACRSQLKLHLFAQQRLGIRFVGIHPKLLLWCGNCPGPRLVLCTHTHVHEHASGRISSKYAASTRKKRELEARMDGREKRKERRREGPECPLWRGFMRLASTFSGSRYLRSCAFSSSVSRNACGNATCTCSQYMTTCVRACVRRDFSSCACRPCARTDARRHAHAHSAAHTQTQPNRTLTKRLPRREGSSIKGSPSFSACSQRDQNQRLSLFCARSLHPSQRYTLRIISGMMIRSEGACNRSF